MIIPAPQKSQANDSLIIHFLRGLAAYMVVAFHARVDMWQGWQAVSGRSDLDAFSRVMSWLSIPAAFGGAGVMLFFILSGYCIALPHAGPQGRPLRFGEYFARRFFRIYPPYLVIIILCGLMTWWASEGGASSLAGTRGYWPSVFMIQNYTSGQITLNPSLWSLPVEMELYLVFPLFYIALRHFGACCIWIAAVVVSAIGMILYEVGWSAAALNFAKFWLIWWSGAMLAEWNRRGELRKPVPLILLGGGLAIGFAVVGTIKNWDPAWLHFPYAFGCFVLLWLLLAYEKKVDPLLRKATPLVIGAGTISYSLYLIHFPLLRLMGARWVEAFGAKPTNFFWALFAILPVTVVALAFYHIVEKPSHLWAKRWSQKCGGAKEGAVL